MEESKEKSKRKKKVVEEVVQEEKNDKVIICPENMKPLLVEFTLIMRKQSKLSKSKRDLVEAFITKNIQDGVIKLKV